ncbi:hypothetical protein [Streptomyces sp. SID11385]|uniref:hypothetical protein n=1 Tax=Streptomyces sp. SID11385 TaxID=2706031 RepID=UPI0013C561F8|nr:hypothetical protein [Streptomyces sp. SID11385]NEA41411.1 hypothetical protein [Streptomyces sp. SID11385]
MHDSAAHPTPIPTPPPPPEGEVRTHLSGRPQVGGEEAQAPTPPDPEWPAGNVVRGLD